MYLQCPTEVIKQVVNEIRRGGQHWDGMFFPDPPQPVYGFGGGGISNNLLSILFQALGTEDIPIIALSPTY